VSSARMTLKAVSAKTKKARTETEIFSRMLISREKVLF
jgi:hypothetical protein